jgi:L-aminopeptidase/D-esterase-like protein
MITSVYGWSNGGNTVEVNVTNTGTTTVNITAARINGIDCPTFNGSNGLDLYPGNSTVLTITYQNNVFQTGATYTITVVTAENNVFSYTTDVPAIPEFPSSLLLPLSVLATLLAIAIHRRKHSSFLEG